MRPRLLICLFAILSIPYISGSAQQLRRFSVAEFVYDPLDLTARSGEHARDGYALIKVKSNLPNDDLLAYHFDFGMMNSIVHHHPETEELWVYVQRNAKMVTISREGYVSVSKYDLRTTIGEGLTYKMMLSVTVPTVYTQMVVFQVKPANSSAVIMVKADKENAMEELFGVTDQTGGVAKNLPFGTYTYKVAADNYYTSEGHFTLNNQSENHVEEVTMKANFATATLNVNADADIYVDGEKRGTRSWVGPLKAGAHQVECRQDKHRSTTHNISVQENESPTFTLTPPEPITGTLSITSRPLGASISIDGKDYGKTPKNVTDLLIGKHLVCLSHTGFTNVQQDVEIIEGQTTAINKELEEGKHEILTSENIPSTEENDASKLNLIGVNFSYSFLDADGVGASLYYQRIFFDYLFAGFNTTLYKLKTHAYIEGISLSASAVLGIYFCKPKSIIRPFFAYTIGWAEAGTYGSVYAQELTLGLQVKLYKGLSLRIEPSFGIYGNGPIFLPVEAGFSFSF